MKQKKFTFQELLMVCACVAVVATLGISALNANGTASAETAVCAGQQSKIFAAISSYASDNEGFLPYFDDEFSIPGCKTRVSWAYRIHEYLPEETGNKNYFCPSAQAAYADPDNRSNMSSPRSCVSIPDRNLESYRFINYGINHEYAASNVGRWASKDPKQYITIKMSAVVNPAEKVLVADAWNGKNYGRNVITHYNAGSNKMKPCHGNAANVLWFDGQVKKVDDPHKTLQNGKNAAKHFRVDK